MAAAAEIPDDIARLRPELEAGARALGLSLGAAEQDRLLAYLALVAKWTRVYNLTSVRSPHEMLTHHLLDSLAVVEPLRREMAALRARAADSGAAPGTSGPGSNSLPLLDVGAGAGLPGVVLAICCPDVDVTCVDTVAKKAAFIQQAAGALRLSICTASMPGSSNWPAPLRWCARAPLHRWPTLRHGRAARWRPAACGWP